MERKCPTSLSLLDSCSKPQQGCSAVPKHGTWWSFPGSSCWQRSWEELPTPKLTFMAPFLPQRQALKWPHIPSHYSNCCSQEKQVASLSMNTAGADLLLSGYFLIEGKKQATLSCFASLCYPEHLILGSKQQGQRAAWIREWNLWGQQEKGRKDSSSYKTRPPSAYLSS